MASNLFKKIGKDPLGAVKRLFSKTVTGPLKYKKGEDYDAAAYWRDRLGKHGSSLTGPGDEGLSEADNERMYEEAAKAFLEIARRENLDLPKLRVLEIGCGNGYYAGLFEKAGVSRYVGVDITDALFSRHAERFPQFVFKKMDATSDRIEGAFDLVVMIDVIQHIVTDERLSFAMQNIADCLAPGGALFLSPITPKGGKHLFYVRWWTLAEIKKRFPDFEFRDPAPFRYSSLLVVRKPLEKP